MFNHSSPSLPHRNIYYSSSPRNVVGEGKYSPTRSSPGNHHLSSDDSAESGNITSKTHKGDSIDVCAIDNDANESITREKLDVEEQQGLLSSSRNSYKNDLNWKSDAIHNNKPIFEKLSINLSYCIVVLGNAFRQGGFQQLLKTFSELISSTLSKIPSEYHTVLSCVCYCFCSLTMVLANKALASSFKADIGFLTILFQAALAVVFLEFFHNYGISTLDTDPVTGAKFEMKLAKQWLPVNCFFVSMLFTGYMSLKYLSVPMVTIFKNLTNVGILFGEWIFQGKKITGIVLASCLIMVVGAVLAAGNDIAFSFLGYFWMIMNCCCTAGYVLYMKHATKTIQLSKNNMAYYNNLLSVPILFLGAWFKGEVSTFFPECRITDFLLFKSYLIRRIFRCILKSSYPMVCIKYFSHNICRCWRT